MIFGVSKGLVVSWWVPLGCGDPDSRRDPSDGWGGDGKFDGLRAISSIYFLIYVRSFQNFTLWIISKLHTLDYFKPLD